MYYIGLDIHKKSISYCVKDTSGQICQQGKVAATRRDLDVWMKALPPTLDGGDGSNYFHRLDLRSSKATRRSVEGSASAHAASDRRIEKEERSH